MVSATCCDGVGRLLAEEQLLVEQLAVALRDEHQAIVARLPEQLESVAAEKQGILQQLELSHQRRFGLLQEAGVATDKSGFTSLLQLCADRGHDYRSAWGRLQENLLTCQQQNEINGKILESGRRAIHSTLSILLGGQGDATELYNQEGKSSPARLGGHTITKA